MDTIECSKENCLLKETIIGCGEIGLCKLKIHNGNPGGRCVTHPTKDDDYCPLIGKGVIIKIIN